MRVHQPTAPSAAFIFCFGRCSRTATSKSISSHEERNQKTTGRNQHFCIDTFSSLLLCWRGLVCLCVAHFCSLSNIGYQDRSKRRGQENVETILRNTLSSSPTSAPLTAPDSEAQPCLPGVSHANLSVVPGSERARKITVTSGLKCLELFRRPDPLGCLVRMLLESSIWNSNKCVLTWRAKAMKSSRLLFQLAPSTPRTEGIGSGLLPTSNTRDWKGARQGRKRGWGGDIGDQIAMLPAMLKTPSTVETEGGVMEIRPGCDGHYKLRDQIAMLPTPAARDYRGSFADNSEAYLERLEHPRGVNLVEELQRQANGTSRGLKLQPAFVEWMMGFPENWTLLEK